MGIVGGIKLTHTNTYRVSINVKEKVILLTKPLKECEYFNRKDNYINGTYILNNEIVKIHKDRANFRENHYTTNYETAKILFENFKKTKKDYFFYNTMEN